MNHTTLSSFIWSVADLLRGDYKQSEYGKVILPFTVLRRLDCVLEATKPAVLVELEQTASRTESRTVPVAQSRTEFLQHLALDMKKLMGDQDHIRENLYSYIQAFSPAVRDIFERFDFHTLVDRLGNQVCCIRSPKSSHRSTCTPKSSATVRWDWYSKS